MYTRYKLMPRPKGSGNPDIHLNPQTFKTDRAEPLAELLQLRVTASMKATLKDMDDWQEFVRQAIADKLEKS